MENRNLSPIAWAMRPLQRYAEFSGRSSRAEFWWFMLAIFILYMVMWFVLFGALIGSLAAAQSSPSAGVFGAIGVGGIFLALLWLALIVPSISVQVRRLHDTNRSGWWLGGFYLLYGVYIALIASSTFSLLNAQLAGASQPNAAGGGLVAGTMILGLVMFVYMIALLVFYCLAGTSGANRFGPDPYGEDVEQVFA